EIPRCGAHVASGLTLAWGTAYCWMLLHPRSRHATVQKYLRYRHSLSRSRIIVGSDTAGEIFLRIPLHHEQGTAFLWLPQSFLYTYRAIQKEIYTDFEPLTKHL